MRRLILLGAVFLVCLQAVAGDDTVADAQAGAAKAKACAACHNAMITLKGRGTKTIAEQMKAIREGKNAHPPGLARLSNEDLASIAAFLDGAD